MTVTRRWPIVALALASASLFAMSVLGPWWSVGELEIGPFGVRACLAGDCASRGLSLVTADALWLRAAVATAAAGLVAAFVLVTLAGATAAGPKRHARASRDMRPASSAAEGQRGSIDLGYVARLAARAALAGIATALAAGAWFVIGFHGVGDAHASFDRGAIMFVLAVALGVVAAVRALRWKI